MSCKCVLISECRFIGGEPRRGDFSFMLPLGIPHSKLNATQVTQLWNVNFDFISGDGVVQTIHVPETCPIVIPSDALIIQLLRIIRYNVLISEADRREIVQAIFNYVLVDNLFALSCASEVSNTGVGSNGRADIMIGSVNSGDDGYLLITEVKKDWGERGPSQKSITQLLAGAGAMAQRRAAVDLYTPVFGILTNGERYRFFVLDTDGRVYSSSEEGFRLSTDSPLTRDFEAELSIILRWLTFFLDTICAISPRCGSNDHYQGPPRPIHQGLDHGEALGRFRACLLPPGQEPHERGQ